jgi:hypothetical protein
MAMMKHVGKVGEKPCVVLFKEVPNEPDNCLVVETSALNPQQHDALMAVIQSPEAQESNEVSEVLNRRQFPDGSNMLTALHYSRKINKVPVSLVRLTPVPNQSVALADVNAELRKIKNQSNPPLKTQVLPEQVEKKLVTEDLQNTVVEPNIQQVVTESQDKPQSLEPADKLDTISVARNLLQQADLLEEDARILVKDAEAKRDQAYDLVPELQPRRGPGRPPKNPVTI